MVNDDSRRQRFESHFRYINEHEVLVDSLGRFIYLFFFLLMGNFVAVPSYRRTYKVSQGHTRRTSTNNERPSTAIERENYYVYYNSTADVQSSIWSAYKKKRRRRTQTNRIKTTRYNIITFLPKNLFDQFHRVANIYFATLIGLNWIPIINAISKTVSAIT